VQRVEATEAMQPVVASATVKDFGDCMVNVKGRVEIAKLAQIVEQR